MNLFHMLALVAVGFLAGAAAATIRISNRTPLRPLPLPIVRRIDPYHSSLN
jgi:hypothetical protein